MARATQAGDQKDVAQDRQGADRFLSAPIAHTALAAACGHFLSCAGTEWTEFDGHTSTMKILGGFGNLEDNLLHFPDGAFRAVAMRSYCATSGNWSIWWLDGRNPTALDTPVVGRFSDHVGLFFADDVLDGQPIKIRFIWTARPGAHPRWEQAFSNDGGNTWETNWEMEFIPARARGE